MLACKHLKKKTSNKSKLTYGFFSVGHDAQMYQLIFKVQENHETG